METLTNSRMKVARLCLRKHHYRFVLGYEAAQRDENLRFGTLVHLGLEAWFRATQHDITGDERLALAFDAMQGEADPFERVRAEEMLRGYDARWGETAWTVLDVEAEFSAPLLNPETGAASKTWTLAGKLDVVVRDEHGRVVIVEHKTSSEDISPGSDYWRRLRMDGQVSTYFFGAAALGYDPEGCLYDVLGKPTIRPARATSPEARKYKKDGTLYANQREQDETPDEYRARVRESIEADRDRHFQRGPVARLETDLREHMTDVWQFAQGLRDWVRTGRTPRNPEACVHFGKTCAFFDVCTGTASLDDTSRFVKLNTPHPELAPALDGA